MMEDLVEKIAHAIDELITEQAFEVPIYVASIAANGSTLVFHCHWTDQEHPEKGFDADIVTEHNVEPGFQFPINIMFVDATGERATRMVMSQKDRQWMH
jgi:hypothetical protein